MPSTMMPTGGGVLCRPRGLLLDFGGVIVQSTKNTGWADELALRVDGLLQGASLTPSELTIDRIRRDLVAGSAAAGRWKDAMSRPYNPIELSSTRFWGDFVGADWPGRARDVVVERGRELCDALTELKSSRTTRPGIDTLLERAAVAGVRVGIVSNTLSGVVHRNYLVDNNLAHHFAAQVYSDEVGLRKPNPDILTMGANAIGVAVEDCWYVGDNVDRDVLCGVRAGVGGNILLTSASTVDTPYDLAVVPHASVETATELAQLFTEAVKPRTTHEEKTR